MIPGSVQWDAQAADFFGYSRYPGVAVMRRIPWGREWLLDHGLTSAEALQKYDEAKAAEDRKPRKPRSWTTRHSRPPPKYVAKEFIAWDGEGVTVKGDHRYVIFANSEGDSIVNPKGLSTQSCFDLLLNRAEKNPSAIHVIFAGSYDANMILKPTLTRAQARRLAQFGYITLKIDGHRYRVEYHPRHIFRISEQLWDPNIDRAVTLRTVTLWDVFGSYQSKFTTACEKRLPQEDLDELDHIAEMKERRGDFRLKDIPEMLQYCFAELRALRKLALIDCEDSEAAGMVGQTRWDGAGAKASIILRANGVKDHMEPTLETLQTEVCMGYAGGRIEPYRFGEYGGPVFTVDLRSAYPWAATMLPSLRGGKWAQVDPADSGAELSDFSLIRLQYRNPTLDTLHPFPWRGPQGGISYPAVTEGWYWAPEVWAAIDCGLGDHITFLDALDFTPASDEKPFGFIPALFHARGVLDKQRKGRGQPLKLALNSIYGKLAQQIGSKEGKPPTYHQLEWAGWITSKVRSEMFRLAYPRRDQLVTIETDGISFTGKPDDEVLSREGVELGDYEVERYDGGVWVQSGIYWLRRDGEWKAPKVRGVGSNPDGSDVLNRKTFVDSWLADSFYAAVPVEVTRFRGLVTSALTDGRWEDWCQWVTETREIAVMPRGKRVHTACSATCGRGLHATLPTGGGSVSAPHKLAWMTKLGAMGGEDLWWTQETAEMDDEVSL